MAHQIQTNRCTAPRGTLWGLLPPHTPLRLHYRGCASILNSPNVYDASEIALQYDRDYEGGDYSLYNQRFGSKRFIMRESDILHGMFQKVVKTLSPKIPVRILDRDWSC